MHGIESSFWSGRRVLVTGHTGFKGAWLSYWLARMGAEVHGLALEPETPGVWQAARLDDLANSVIGDIRDLETVRRVMDRVGPEVVFHMAAQSLVRPSYVDPVGTYATNVLGTVHVLEAARLCGSVRALVVVTTDKCYENREWVWPYREEDRLGGHDPYSNSKACAELVTSAYASSFIYADGGARFGLASARAGNVIGGGDWARDRLIPDLVRGFVGRTPVAIRNPAAVRPWQHVLEPLSGYMKLAARLHAEPDRWRGGWNFGPDLSDVRPVSWIADRAVGIWGGDAGWTRTAGPQPHEAQILKLDISKAREQLGWHPRWSVDVAVDRTLAWYRAHARTSEVSATRALLDADIDEFASADGSLG